MLAQMDDDDEGCESPTLEYEEEDELMEVELEGEDINDFKSQYRAELAHATQGDVYNPHQDQREVLKVRQGYTHLLEEISQHKREILSIDSTILSDYIEEANSHFSRGKLTTAKIVLNMYFLQHSPHHNRVHPRFSIFGSFR